jgi:hypothetical protein
MISESGWDAMFGGPVPTMRPPQLAASPVPWPHFNCFPQDAIGGIMGDARPHPPHYPERVDCFRRRVRRLGRAAVGQPLDQDWGVRLTQDLFRRFRLAVSLAVSPARTR